MGAVIIEKASTPVSSGWIRLVAKAARSASRLLKLRTGRSSVVLLINTFGCADDERVAGATGRDRAFSTFSLVVVLEQHRSEASRIRVRLYEVTHAPGVVQALGGREGWTHLSTARNTTLRTSLASSNSVERRDGQYIPTTQQGQTVPSAPPESPPLSHSTGKLPWVLLSC